jgi:hypothetical protein
MRLSAFAAVAVLALAAAGCSSGQSTEPSASPAAPTATATPSPPPTPEPCSADRVRDQVQQMLAGRTYETHYLTINDELTLSVWLVDPEINAAARTSLSAGNRQALETGLTLSYQIVDRIPCAAQVFENVNPMIVDSDYASWYIDIIPARAFLNLRDATLTGLIESVSRSGAGPASGRLTPPRKATPAPSGSCTWPQARAALAARLGPETDNAAAYVIVGGGIAADSRWGDSSSGVAVQAQIEAHQDADTQDAALLARLGEMAGELACVSPAVGQLELFVVDGSGRLVVYARVPGMLIRAGKGPLPPGTVLLYHYPLPTSPDAQDSGSPT